jgi:hypothetical protein
MIVCRPRSYAGIAAPRLYLAAGIDMNGNVRCKLQMPDSAWRVGDTLFISNLASDAWA